MHLTIEFEPGEAPRAEFRLGPRAAGPTALKREAVAPLVDALEEIWPPDPEDPSAAPSAELRAAVERWRDNTRAKRQAAQDDAAEAKAALDAFAEVAPP